MDTATARRELERMVQWTEAPALSSAEVDDLLLLARRTDANGNVPLDVWRASTVYVVGDARIPTVANGTVYKVTTAGTSGSAEPTWPSTGTVADGTVVWTVKGRYLWTPTYDLRRAAAAGWEWKAGKVAAKYDVAVGDGTRFDRSQQFDMCMKMAKSFGGGGAGRLSSLRLESSLARRTHH